MKIKNSFNAEKAILHFGILLKLIFFIVGLFVGGSYIDEAMLGLNANSLAQNMTDSAGRSLPVYFDSWISGGQSPMATYLSALTVKLFGFNYFGIRLPMLVCSCASFVAFYYLTKELFSDRKSRLTALAFACVSPWIIFTASFVLDCNYLAHFLVIGCLFLVKAVKKDKTLFYILSMLFFGLCFYCYLSSVLFVPVFLACFYAIMLINKKISLGKTAISVLTIFIVSVPFILFGLVLVGVLPPFKLFGFGFYSMEKFIRSGSVAFFRAKNISEGILLCIYNLFRSIYVITGGSLLNNKISITMFVVSNPFGGVLMLLGVIKIIFSSLKGEKKNSPIQIFMLSCVFAMIFYCIAVCDPLPETYYRYGVFAYVLILFEVIGFTELLRLLKKVNFKKVFSVYFSIALVVSVFIYFGPYLKAQEDGKLLIYGDNMYKVLDIYENTDYDNITFYLRSDGLSKMYEERISVYSRYYYANSNKKKFVNMRDEFIERYDKVKDFNGAVQFTEDESIKLRRIGECNKPTENLVVFDESIENEIVLCDDYKTYKVGTIIIAYKGGDLS